MVKFIIRRFLWTIPVILLVVLLTFTMMRQIKGNPFQVTERAVPASIQRNLDRKYHLDKPWYTQYAVLRRRASSSSTSARRSCSGTSRSTTSSRSTSRSSLKLGCLAMLWAVLIGIPLGVIAALKQNTIIDYVTMVFVNLGYAIPNFLLCTLLIYFFAVKWGDVTGFPTNGIESGWKSWILPAIALGHAPMTLFARIVRGSMLETLQQDYIRTARRRGCAGDASSACTCCATR